MNFNEVKQMLGLENMLENENAHRLARTQQEPILYNPRGNVNEHHADLDVFCDLLQNKSMDDKYMRTAFTYIQERYGTDVSETARNIGVKAYHKFYK